MSDNDDAGELSDSDNHVVSSKRRRLDENDLPNFNNLSRASVWESTYLKAEINVHRSRLSATESAAIELRKIQIEIEEVFAQEDELLRIQASVERDTIRHLEKRLEVLSGQDIESEPILPDDLSLIRRKAIDKIEPPESERSTLAHPNLSPAEKENLSCLKTRANELQEQLQSAHNIITTLCEVVTGHPLLGKSSAILANKVAGNLLSKRESRKQESSPDRRAEDEVPEVGESSGKRDISVKDLEECKVVFLPNTKMNQGPSCSQSHAKQASPSNRSLQLCRVAIYDHQVLVSHPKFFKIEWKKYYQRIETRTFMCKKCSEIRSYKYCIEDHVWCSHLGGSFHCLYCLDSAFFSSRRSLIRHMQVMHANEAPKDIPDCAMQNHESLKGASQAEEKIGRDLYGHKLEKIMPHKKDSLGKAIRKPPKVCRVRATRSHSMIVEKSFLQLDWDHYYERISARSLKCKSCTYVCTQHDTMKDHVWALHCGGKFKCPYCRKLYMYRRSFAKHMKLLHSDVMEGKEIDEDKFTVERPQVIKSRMRTNRLKNLRTRMM